MAIAAWQGKFGRAYTERNDMTPEQLDGLYLHDYGISRTALNQRFLSDLPKSAKILEVGCNMGTQLQILQNMGFSNLAGCDIQDYAIEEARKRMPQASFQQASASLLPYADEEFDLVFTSGLLIHIPPTDLYGVMREIHRVTKRWIWSFEYWSEFTEEVYYRGNAGMLWKMDYADRFFGLFPDLILLRKEEIHHSQEPLIDCMFMLYKFS